MVQIDLTAILDRIRAACWKAKLHRKGWHGAGDAVLLAVPKYARVATPGPGVADPWMSYRSLLWNVLDGHEVRDSSGEERDPNWRQRQFRHPSGEYSLPTVDGGLVTVREVDAPQAFGGLEFLSLGSREFIQSGVRQFLVYHRCGAVTAYRFLRNQSDPESFVWAGNDRGIFDNLQLNYVLPEDRTTAWEATRRLQQGLEIAL